jgi:hypothetical protein
MEEISSRCNDCNQKQLPVLFKLLSNSNGLIYSGNCSNALCPHPNKYLCKPCYDYSMKNTILNGGRKAAHYTSMKSLKQHVKSSNVHTTSLIDYYNLQKIDDENYNYDNNIEIANDNDNETIPSILDKNNSTSGTSNYTSNTNYDAFASKSKSIKYYKYENKYPGNGPKYLIGNAFHKREEDYEKISKEECTFF